ncbi:lipocalin family protein [Halpernia sp.]|uniref:lipocalin family protein n=1 Tax=Halpernia sp. TaxID=2782209 RepID=UPI003A8F8491
MKNLITILSILFIFSSCSRSTNNNEEVPDVPTPKEFVGKWKLVEICQSDGSSTCDFKPFDSGKVYDVEYKKDGTLYGNGEPSNCANGTFYFSKDLKVLNLKFNCQTQYTTTNIMSISSTEMLLGYQFLDPEMRRYKKIETSN